MKTMLGRLGSAADNERLSKAESVSSAAMIQSVRIAAVSAVWNGWSNRSTAPVEWRARWRRDAWLNIGGGGVEIWRQWIWIQLLQTSDACCWSPHSGTA